MSDLQFPDNLKDDSLYSVYNEPQDSQYAFSVVVYLIVTDRLLISQLHFGSKVAGLASI